MGPTNEVQVFTNPEFGEIRTLTIDGMPWFVLKDVCEVLGATNDRNVAARLDTDEKGVQLVDTLGGPQEMTVINESGLYSVILRSDKPKAKTFRKWVTSEVLPAIRREGAYVLPRVSGDSQTPVRTLTPDDYLAAARLIAGCRTDRLGIVIRMLESGGWDMGDTKRTLAISGSTADIGEKIVAARDRYRLSYNYISAHTGISPQTIRAYAEGRRYPRPDRYNLICECICDAEEAIDEIMSEENEGGNERYGNA